MPNGWMEAATNAGQSAIGGVIGLALGGIENRRQLEQQERLNQMSYEQHKLFTDYNTRAQMEMWRNTNYSAQMAELKKAGLNPGLMYGQGGPGGSLQAATGGAGGPAATRANDGITGMGMGMQLAMMGAQKRLLEAQATKAEAEATKTSGVDTEGQALQNIIAKYTGMEAKDVYEHITSPNRDIQAKTYQDEMEARQGVAGTIYELWVDGKLMEKSLHEIEGIALGNAKTREEIRRVYKEIELLEQNIKGATIGNVIAELEAKIQSKTGVDKASPAWMKVLARLFVGLTGK